MLEKVRGVVRKNCRVSLTKDAGFVITFSKFGWLGLWVLLFFSSDFEK